MLIDEGAVLTLTDDTQVVTLSLDGELDASAACDLRARLADIPAQVTMLLDLSDVTFVDSAGLGVLIGGIRRLRAGGGAMVLCAPRPAIARMLHTAGLDRIVPIEDTLAAAASRL